MAARSVRRAAVLVHRWTGLAMAMFLLVVAATGAVLPFQVDLRRLAAPERFLAASLPRQVDWLALRDTAERVSGGLVDLMPLHLEDGAAPIYNPVARPGAPPLPFDELVLDPSDGREIARGREGDLRDGAAQVVPFLYKLHQNLASGGWGELLLGLVALGWTLDCFLGIYLSLPATWSRRGWWRRWRTAWTVRMPPVSAARLQVDLHRAPGLWFWAMMLLFAWTGVAFNLPAVYAPVMGILTGYQPSTGPPEVRHAAAPRLGWAEGLAAVRTRAAEVAEAQGFRIVRERELRFQRGANRYAYALRTDRDRSDDGANTWVSIDADTGALLSVELPTGVRAGNTIDYWLGSVHTASVGGLTVRVLVSASGVAIMVVTITGVLIWAHRRRARASRASATATGMARENA